MKTERKPTWWKWDGRLRPSPPSRGYEHVPRISDQVHAALSACGNDDANLPPELQAEADEQLAAACLAIRAMYGLPVETPHPNPLPASPKPSVPGRGSKPEERS